MKHQWYQSLESGRTPSLRCERCQVPIKPTFKNSKHFFNGREIQKRSLCPLCEKRDRELLLAVNDCIRLYGSMVTLYEIMDLYGDLNRAKQLHFDPFSVVRVMYQGEDQLTIQDIEAWIEEGILEMSKGKKLSVRASEAREEIQRQVEIQDELEEEDEDFAPLQVAEQITRSLNQSRLREGGGASMGWHRWVNRQNLK